MVLSDRGAPLARIGFNISQMFSQMIKPSSQAQEVLSQLGYSFYDTNNKMKPMGQILNDLRNKLKDYNEESQAQMLNILFNIRAGRAALALIKDTGKSYDDVTESIKNSAGATRLMAEAIKQTPYGMYQIAINNLNANLIVLGNYLLPIVTDLISTLTSYVALAVDWWSNLSESTKSTIISFIKFVAIGGPILVTLGVITEAFGTLGKALLWLSSTAIPKLAIALKYLILNPVGLVITALGTLLYYLGFFDISLGKTTNNIQDYSKLIGDSVTNAFGKMGKAMEAGTGEYKKNSDEMAKDAEKLADKMQDATEKMTESLQELDLQIQKSEFTFKESLAEMIKSHQDKVNELDEQLASEKGEFDRIQNDKLKSFQDKTFDMKKEHERRLEDLQYELRQELLRGRKADQDRIYDLRTRISREIQDYNDEFAQLQQEYQQDTLNAKAEHDKKTADLQARLNEETSLLQKHSTEVLMVKDFQFRDEIQKLVDSHTEQMAEYDAQKAKIKKNFEDQQKEVNTATGDMFGNMVTQAGQTVEGINNQFKNIGTNLNFDEFNKIGQEVGKQTSDGAGEGFMKGGFWKILRFLGEAAKTTFFPNIAKQEEQKFVYELLKQSAPLNNEEMSQKINDFIKNNKHSGGLIHAQSGTIIPGASPLRDRVPVMAEPGEGIMSREAVNNFLRNGTTGGDTYNYNIEIRPGTMIATRGEQREFAREIKRLISEDNMRTATYLS